jgi:5-methylcytosine-specific restriction endonuclease McrA
MKLEKINCEICGEKNKEVLHFHHIIEQTDTDCSNNPWNISIVCPSCHSKIHNKNIKIIGVWPSTKAQGRLLIYIKDGICNVPGMKNEVPPHLPKNESMKIRN